MGLFIPHKLDEILKKDNRNHTEINRIINEFSVLIKDNKVEFFPEYTDHGLQHIQSVLNTAEEILNEESFNIINSEDIYVLISSIILHIDKHGLWSLLTNDKFNGTIMGEKDSRKWIDKWNDFKKDIDKFDENDWISFFGKDEFIELPKIDEENLTDNQKVLIGDFIRQHHANIAQVIASYGLPIKDGSYDLFNTEFTTLNQLSGFIAKSHNYSLRDMIDTLGGDYKSRVHLKTHPAFLMGVLRIADYLQFTEERTPKILFNTRGKGMCSPVSIKEWKKHLAILNTDKHHSDNELIFIHAQPNDAYTLEDIKKLFKGFQNELDSFWAVNGEIYSRYNDLSGLGINIRRIRSNIDNPQDYVKQNNKTFYPEVLSIKSDNQKILPLLVSPLYGDEPSIGLRELLQNSIDACNERYSVEIKKEVNEEYIPYKINITINIDESIFIIEDNGIGMDIDTIKNYFLKIGASYRYSEAWKALHLEENKSFVPRTGKFGIGMLAGFLIGDEIKVISKKNDVASDEAITFSYNLNEKDIQVDFLNIVECGTKIIIKSSASKLEKLYNDLSGLKEKRYFDFNDYYRLQSFWYFLDSPKVIINVIKDKNELFLDNKLTINKKTIYSEWESVENTELDGFYWKLGIGYYSNYAIFCNGIIINNLTLPNVKLSLGINHVDIGIEKISIFDNHGKFPLNLTRNGLLIDKFYELEKLEQSIIQKYFQTINSIIEKVNWDKDSIIETFTNYFYMYQRKDILPFVIFKDNIIPLVDKKLKDKYILFDLIYTNQKRGIIYNKNSFSLLKDIGYCCVKDIGKEAYITEVVIKEYIYNQINTSTYSSRYSDKWKSYNLDIDSWVFIKKYDFNKLDNSFIEKFKEDALEIIDFDKDWFILCKDINKNSIPQKGKDILNLKNLNSFIFVISKVNDNESSEFAELWEKYIVED